MKILFCYVSYLNFIVIKIILFYLNDLIIKYLFNIMDVEFENEINCVVVVYLYIN